MVGVRCTSTKRKSTPAVTTTKAKAKKMIKKQKARGNVTYNSMMSLLSRTYNEEKRFIINVAIDMLGLRPIETSQFKSTRKRLPPIPPKDSLAALTFYMLWRFRRTSIYELGLIDKHIALLIAHKVMH